MNNVATIADGFDELDSIVIIAIIIFGVSMSIIAAFAMRDAVKRCKSIQDRERRNK